MVEHCNDVHSPGDSYEALVTCVCFIMNACVELSHCVNSECIAEPSYHLSCYVDSMRDYHLLADCDSITALFEDPSPECPCCP